MAANEQKAIALRFSASSDTYDQSVIVQPMVIKKVCEMLAGQKAMETVLEIGCGTGMLTEKLAVLFPLAHLEAMDVSEKMLAQSKRRLNDNNRIQWTLADIRQFNENKKYQLIVSCSSLHWIIPIKQAIKKLSCLLSNDGRLVFGLMVEGTLQELRETRLRVAKHKPPMGKLPSVAEVRTALQESGLDIKDEEQEKTRISYPSAAVLLRSLHKQGVTGGVVSISSTPLNRNELHRLISDYNSSYKNDHGVYASYHMAYFFAEPLM